MTTVLEPGAPAGAAPVTDPVLGATRFGPYEIRWVETGPVDGPGMLLLHGLYAGATGYEWRRLAPLLARTHRVRVADLLGAGGSDRPRITYTPDVVGRSVAALMDDAGPGVHVVASSLTGAYALRAVAGAGARPGGRRPARLTLVTPSGLGPERQPAAPALVADVVERTPLGDAVVRALTSRPSVRWFQRHRTYADPDALTVEEEVVTQRSGRLPGAKHLQLAFVSGRLDQHVDPADVRVVRPTVLWGDGQRFVDDGDASRWAAAGARVVHLGSGLPHVEEPDRVAQLL